MKKLTYPLLAGLLMLVSCNKSGNGAGPVASPDQDAPVAVRLTSNMRTPKITKSEQGALDEWNGQKLFIYGLRYVDGKYVIPEDETGDPYNPEDVNAYLIRNVDATAPKKEEESEQKLLTGSINVYRDKTAEEFFFYRQSTNEIKYNYRFFGYFVDDAATAEYKDGDNPKPVETSETIELGVEIDGTQDILLAQTNPASDKESADVAISESRLYSDYSARHNVTPNLIFKHQLSRFNFKIKKGGSASAVVEDNIEISRITVESVKTGRLVIASNTDTEMKLIPDDTEMSVLDVVLPEDPEQRKPQSYGETDPVPYFGKPIMVMPGKDKYKVTLYFSQVGYTVNDGEQPIEMSIDFTDEKVYKDGVNGKDTMAQAGHAYDVTIYVYSLEQVDINVTLAEWDSTHGEFELDPDKNAE